MSTKPKVFDYIVIGAGSGGLLVAVGLQKLGKRVAVISKNIGGDCTHFGCIPSKTLIHLSKEYQACHDLAVRKQIKTTALQQVGKKVASFASEEKELLSNEVYFMGSAEFVNKNTIQVSTADSVQLLSFTKKCIIATGSAPVRTTVTGIPASKLITNEEFFYLDSLPKSITIFGGGPIGAELASACARFGIETYLLSKSYLAREPEEISRRSLQSLIDLGVKYIPARAESLKNKELLLDTGATIPETELYLSAIGRIPNTDFNLEQAAVEYDKKGIVINQNLVTTNSHIFAIGDCTHSPQFTHLAANHGKFVLKKILLPFSSRRDRALPRVTFVSPTIASVGELEVKDHHRVFVLDFAKTDRGRTNFDTLSYGEVVVDLHSGAITGASLFGDFSEDLINVVTLIIDEKISVLSLADFMTPYPTYANVFHTLSLEYLNYLTQNWKTSPIQTGIQLLAYALK